MEAVVIASKLRLRPILMTAFTAIIGCLPWPLPAVPVPEPAAAWALPSSAA